MGCINTVKKISAALLQRWTITFSVSPVAAMLTAINDLRRAKHSIFFIATNRLRAFDAAITRRGRFDMQLFVGTPNLESRIIQFKEKLADVSVPNKTKDQAIEAYRHFLEAEWSNDAMYMNYLEGMVSFLFPSCKDSGALCLSLIHGFLGSNLHPRVQT